MNILILNWRDIKHPLAGGAEFSLFEHAKYWRKKGASVIWFASIFPTAKREEMVNGVKIVRYGSHYTVHMYALFYYIKHLRDWVDVVIDSFHFVPFFTPLYIKRARIIGLINEVAGRVWFSNASFPIAVVGFITEPLFFHTYRNISFITSSNSTKLELENLGILPKNIIIIPHGITSYHMHSSFQKEELPTILFLGRISRDKGIHDVFKAYQLIRKKGVHAKLWVVGKEQKKGYLDLLIDRYSLSHLRYISDLRYFGFVKEEKKFELLARSWILLHPSQKEGWGLNVIEAALKRTPTIGYNVAGLRDSIKHGETGLLVEKNPALLAEAALELILDGQRLKKMGYNAKQWAKNFKWEKSTSQSWKFIQSNDSLSVKSRKPRF